MDALKTSILEFVDLTQGPALALDDSLHLIRANKAFCLLFGQPAEGVPPFEKLFPQRELQYIVEQTLTQKHALEGHPTRLVVNGVPQQFSLNARRFMTDEGCLFLLTLAQLSTRSDNLPVRSMNGSQADEIGAEDLLGAIDDIIFTATLDGTIESLNPVFETLYGIPREDYVGRNFVELVHPAHVWDARATLADILDKRKWGFFELHTLAPDGRSVYIDIKAAPRKQNGEVVGVWGVARDVTMRRQSEQSLQESQTRLKMVDGLLRHIIKGASIDHMIEYALRSLAEHFKGIRAVYSMVAKNGNLSVVRSIAPDGMPSLDGMVLDLNMAPAYFRRLQAREVLIVRDVANEEYLSPILDFLRTGSTRAVLDVPMYHSEAFFGVLCLEGCEIHEWTMHEVATLSHVAECLSVAFQDATARAQRAVAENALRESEEKFRLLAENIRAAFWVFDTREKRILYTNPYYALITGQSREKMRDAAYSWLDVIHPEDRARVLKFVEVQEGGQAIDCEYRVVKSDGIRWVHSRAFPVFDREGNLYRITGIAEDITESKRSAQQALDLALEREKVTLAEAFVNEISHDFRTPITISKSSAYLITRFTEKLLEKLNDLTSANLDYATQQLAVSHIMETGVAIHEHSLRLETSLKHLHKLVESLLEMFRLDRQYDFQFTHCDLNALIMQTVEIQRSIASEKNIYVKLDLGSDLPQLYADETEFGRVIQNLLDNAIRYTPKNGVISIRTEYDMPHEQLIMEVTDTGVGISDINLPHVFDRFFRVEGAKNTGSSGMGLGLAIVKKIVTAHQGSIVVESTLGTGTTFRVVLPGHVNNTHEN